MGTMTGMSFIDFSKS